jgi:iron complex outermembrane receptor protein
MLKGALTLKNMNLNLRTGLLAFTACTMVGMIMTAAPARAQSATTADAAPSAGTETLQKIKIVNKKLILREKDIPNAVSVITQTDIQAEGETTGSIQTLLNKTPSVVAYTQGPGQNAPTLAIRGVRNDELAETLDGIPLDSLLEGSGNYLSNNIGSPLTLGQIDGTDIYPGIAPPDHQGFGTIGGTIAYTSKKPTDDPYAELEGGFGSFNTQHVGFTLNSGKLWDSDNAAKALLIYDQSQTSGYVDYTKAQYHDFLFNVVKPYNDGLSNVGLLVIFNQGKGLVQTEPAPTALIDANSKSFNFSPDLGFYNQAGQFLTTILSDHTYINPNMVFDGSFFYEHSNATVDDYGSVASATSPFTVNVQDIGTFFGPIGPSAQANFGSPFYSPGYFTYDPLSLNPGADPTDPSSYYAGETNEYSVSHGNNFGITPKLTIFAGDHNAVTIGGLMAKETSGGSSYIYGGDAAQDNQIDGFNSFAFGGGSQRTVYDVYVQDKISLFDDKLQILPGVKVDAAYSSNIQQVTDGIYNPQKLQNFTKIAEPYLGVSYNLPDHFVLFGSAGKGSLFSPISDYASGAASGLTGGTSAPTPEIVYLYEGGLRYDTNNLYLNFDYYYQEVHDAFAVFYNFVSNEQFFANNGGYLFRGIEASGRYQLTPQISLFANGSYNKTQYTKSYFALDTLQQDQFGYAFAGRPLSNVPDWDGNIGVDYDNGPFSARVAGKYTGREYTTYDIITPPVIPGVPPAALVGATTTNTQIENPANFLVNVLLKYKLPVKYDKLKDVTLSLNVQNLLGATYYVYTYQAENPVNGVYGIAAPFNAGFIGAPREFTVDLTARF